MYTRCPECQTVFRITAAQLKARAGQVRCGRCQHIFDAETHLVEAPARPAPKKRAARKGAKHEKKSSNLELPYDDTAGMAPEGGRATTVEDDRTVPPEPLWLAPRSRTRTFYWAAGNSLLLILLFLQGVFFYGRDIVRVVPLLETTLDAVCDHLPCRKPILDMRRLDLIESQVAPHPRYDKALRVRAALVNRAETAQPYPLLELSLLDNNGRLLARRAYLPKEYLAKDAAGDSGLTPNLAVNIEIDIASPGPQASGYEILLLPPPG